MSLSPRFILFSHSVRLSGYAFPNEQVAKFKDGCYAFLELISCINGEDHAALFAYLTLQYRLADHPEL